jgi:hypothetical protein
VRRKLYAQGFPRPVSLGRWSPIAVANWLANPPPAPAKKRRRSGGKSGGNAYAEPA